MSKPPPGAPERGLLLKSRGFLNLPADFRNNISHYFGEKGQQWLLTLPALLAEALSTWDLTLAEPMPLSINYVTAARRADGQPVVLKIGVPHRELTSEICALRIFDGQGCARLLAVKEEKGMFLLERLLPGRMLAELPDDELRTQLACDLAQRIQRPAPAGLPLIHLEDLFAGLAGVRKQFGGTSGPFPSALFERVEALIPELFQTSAPPVLMHGDLHHFNILSSGPDWLAIDPKGIIGPPELECGPLLINPYPDFAYLPDALRQTGRRIAILSERLGYPRQRIRDWGICFAVLSAWWNTAPDGSGSEYSTACAQLIQNAEI